MLVCMLCVTLLGTGVVATAADGVSPSEDGTRVLTVLGDSIAAGSGLTHGPLGNDVHTPFDQIYLRGDELVEGSYPQLVGAEANFDVVHKDAREMFTTDNLLRMLDDSYDAELAKPENYYDRFVTEMSAIFDKSVTLPDFIKLKNNIKNDVAESDVVIINIGSNDVSTMAALDPIFRTLYYTFGMEIQPAMTALKGQLNAIETPEDFVEMIGGYEDFLSKMQSSMAEYKVKMDRMIAAIRELNPTCDIYYLGMNGTAFYNIKPVDSEISEFFRSHAHDLADQFRTYATVESAYKDDIIYVDIDGAECWEADPIYSPTYFLYFLQNAHPNYVGHRHYADRILAAMREHEGTSGDAGGSHDNCPSVKYADLNTSMWYHEPVDYVLNKGIMTGYTDTTWEPFANITRAQVATILYAMEGKPEVTTSAGFTDVAADAWYVNPVNWAASTGVVAGMGDGTFSPNTNVTREQLATMLRSYAEYKGKNVTATGDVSKFADAASISAWATEPVSWAVGAGLISGRDGNVIAPQGTATRAEAATMFWRFDVGVMGK